MPPSTHTHTHTQIKDDDFRCEKMGAKTLKSFVHVFNKKKKTAFSASKYTSTVTT